MKEQRPFLIGLTGSIGMGKSTTASMFAGEGVPVWDADEAVSRLYAKGGAGVEAVGALRPDAVTDGCVDRAALKKWIAADPAALAQLEAVIHPLTDEDRKRFISSSVAGIVVLDVPLLYETGGEAKVDAVAVASVPMDIQRKRVLKRGEMTEDELEAILARQMPDKEKRERADYLIDTRTLETARDGVQFCLKDIRSRLSSA